MKKVLLVMVISAVLVTLGFAQAPAAGSNTDQANVKGCLGGSDGNYTVAEDGTGQMFKITTSSVDLKPHLGHDVNLMGHKASGAVSSGAADNSFAVTELSMISEHCAAAAVAPAATVSPSSETVTPPAAAAVAVSPSSDPVSAPAVEAAAPAATASPSSAPVSTPAVDAATPAATVSPSSAPVSTPAVEAVVPAETVTPSSAPVSTPAVEAAASAATVSPSSAPVNTPAVEAVSPTRRPSARARKRSATQAAAATEVAATVIPSSETVTPPAAESAPPAATASPSQEPVSPPVAASTTHAATHRGGLLWLLILFVVLVVALGSLAPLLGKWRKRKILERTGTPNLSFTNESTPSDDQDKSEPRKVA